MYFQCKKDTAPPCGVASELSCLVKLGCKFLPLRFDHFILVRVYLFISFWKLFLYYVCVRTRSKNSAVIKMKNRKIPSKRCQSLAKVHFQWFNSCPCLNPPFRQADSYNTVAM